MGFPIMREPVSESSFAEELELGFSFVKKFEDFAPPFWKSSQLWRETAPKVSAW